MTALPLLRISVAALLFLGALAPRPLAAAPGAGGRSRQLVTCGRERVHIIELNTAGEPRIVWTWQAAGRSDLPAEYRSLFRATDECKPFDGGRRILITASTGAVALVDRTADRVVFHGRAVNAHSADLLPKGRVAVAASRDPKGNQGDALILFDLEQPGRELWRGELPSGHGVVWDEQRQILWALADHDIRSFTLADWDTAAPKLTRSGLFKLPEGGGHELASVPGTPLLAVSTATKCWVFHRDTKAIAPHPTMAAMSSIKCISQHPSSQIAFVQADRPNWWSERIQFINPAGSLSLPGEQFYKVRWVIGGR